MIGELLLLLALLTGWGDSPAPPPATRMEFSLKAAPPAHPPLPKVYRKAYKPPGEFVDWMLPYEKWEEQDRRLFSNLYGDPSTKLDPRAIVMHYSTTEWPESIYNGFVAGATMWDGEKFFHGHPSVHLVVDKDGTVYQLLPLDRRGTGAYGVDYLSLSIEMVAVDEADLLSRPKQVFASFCLVKWLMQQYDIPAAKVWGHYEVGLGKSVVPEYKDLKDKSSPDRYPPEAGREDPGERYMYWLRYWLATQPSS